MATHLQLSTVLCIILLFTITNAFEYVQFSNINKRISKIYFPKDAWDDFPSELYSYQIFVSPVTIFVSLADTLDLCQDFKDPKNFSSSCENYFCSTNGGVYDVDSKNQNLTESERIESALLHIKMERYCTLCNQTVNQNFTFEKFDKCQINQTYNRICATHNECPPWSVCIPLHILEVSNSRPFENAKPICYDFTDNTFYAHIDFTHKFLYWCYYRYIPLIGLIGQSIAIFIYTVFLIIPEIAMFINTIFVLRVRCMEAFFLIFSLRNISLYIMYLVLFITFICSFIDVLGFLVFRLTTAMNFVGGGTIVLCYFINIILWQYILEQSKKSFEKIPSFSWKIK
jgi:hypothetical protein